MKWTPAKERLPEDNGQAVFTVWWTTNPFGAFGDYLDRLDFSSQFEDKLDGVLWLDEFDETPDTDHGWTEEKEKEYLWYRGFFETFENKIPAQDFRGWAGIYG